MKKILILIAVGLLFSCSHFSRNDTYVALSPNSYSTEEYEMIKKIVYYGDTIAYQKMFDNYDDNSRISDFLSYSLIMANKYDFPQAYYDVFYILTMLPQVNFEMCDTLALYCLDKKTQEFALNYFKQAISKGNIVASEDLLNRFCKNQSYPINELYLDGNLITKAKQNINQDKE